MGIGMARDGVMAYTERVSLTLFIHCAMCTVGYTRDGFEVSIITINVRRCRRLTSKRAKFRNGQLCLFASIHLAFRNILFTFYMNDSVKATVNARCYRCSCYCCDGCGGGCCCYCCCYTFHVTQGEKLNNNNKLERFCVLQCCAVCDANLNYTRSRVHVSVCVYVWHECIHVQMYMLSTWSEQ